jgi:hypothetical protein
MKKGLLLACLCMMLILTACAKESHASETSVIDDFFSAYLAQDFEIAKNYIASDDQISFDSLQNLISDQKMNDVVINHMTNMSYKVISTEEEGDQSTVQIRVIYRNAGGAFMNAIGSMYVDASEGKLSNDDPNTINTYIKGLLYKHLDQELETMDRERTMTLIKENDQWRIVLTEEIKNALSANMLNAIEELKIMGVQF